MSAQELLKKHEVDKIQLKSDLEKQQHVCTKALNVTSELESRVLQELTKAVASTSTSSDHQEQKNFEYLLRKIKK